MLLSSGSLDWSGIDDDDDDDDFDDVNTKVVIITYIVPYSSMCIIERERERERVCVWKPYNSKVDVSVLISIYFWMR